MIREVKGFPLLDGARTAAFAPVPHMALFKMRLEGAVEFLDEPGEFALGEDGSFSIEITVTEDFVGALDEGRYGHCYECGDEIAEARLRALPFAVRCKDCEEEMQEALQEDITQDRVDLS